MSKAPAGEIYVSELVRRAAGDGFAWEALEPLQLKGKAAAVAAYALTGSTGRRSRRVIRYALPIVGRDGRARASSTRARDAAARAGGRIVGISAEAGMGKSRLVAEFVREARRRGLRVAFGECQSFGTSTSYFVWREIWRTLLRRPRGRCPRPSRLLALEAGAPRDRPGARRRARRCSTSCSACRSPTRS